MSSSSPRTHVGCSLGTIGGGDLAVFNERPESLDERRLLPASVSVSEPTDRRANVGSRVDTKPVIGCRHPLIAFRVCAARASPTLAS
jgi:hypothetical protein